jgi:hypothetical protein
MMATMDASITNISFPCGKEEKSLPRFCELPRCFQGRNFA